MEKILDQTVSRIINLMADHGLKVDTWLMDALRIEIMTALMTACLMGRTEALHQVIDHIKAIKESKA